MEGKEEEGRKRRRRKTRRLGKSRRGRKGERVERKLRRKGDEIRWVERWETGEAVKRVGMKLNKGRQRRHSEERDPSKILPGLKIS